MSDLTKSNKTLVREVYTHSFDENAGTNFFGIGSNAYVGNGIYPLYNEKSKVGYIMFTANSRNVTTDNYFYTYQAGLFLNDNNDLLSISYNVVSTINTGEHFKGTELSVKPTFSSGKYQGKDVNVTIKFLKDHKRKVIITYKA